MDDSDTVTFNIRSHSESPHIASGQSVEFELQNLSENPLEQDHFVNRADAGDGDNSNSIIEKLEKCFDQVRCEFQENIQSVQNQVQINLSDFEAKLNSLQNRLESRPNKNNSTNTHEPGRLSSQSEITDCSDLRSFHRRESLTPGCDVNSRVIENRALHEPADGSRLKMKPPTYNGSDDLDEYLTQFNLVSDLNGWSYETKSLFLASSLSGSTRTVLCELPAHARRDYDSIINALQNRYGSIERAEIYRSQLQSKVLEKNETIPELAQTVRKLTRKAYPTASQEVLELLALDFFIDALPDMDMRLR